MVKEKIMVMDNKQRMKDLKTLIKSGVLITTGEMIGVTMKETKETRPVIIFCNHEEGIWAATPIGLPLFEAKDLHEWCKDHATDTFLKNFDRMLKTKTSGLK